MLNMQIVALMVAGAAALSGAASNTASAMPMAGALALSETAGNDVLPVWWYREWGSGSAPAFAPVAPPYYYRSYPRYYYSYYDAPPRAHRYDYDDAYDRYYAYERYPAPRYGRGAVAYCASRYLSWDPETGTFIGYDGLRHPCP
jgi:hypothetical protein